jgi:predicted metalloprotease with PDZ domain
MIYFTVDCNAVHQHIFTVELRMQCVASVQEFMLPNWIVGSYKIRDYAKNITNIAVKNGEITQISKNQFQVQIDEQEIILKYQVYAFEKSVRHAYLDENRAFFNGNSLFFLPLGCEKDTYQVTINYPKNWQVATSLESSVENNNTHYIAHNYFELLDSPFEIAEFTTFDFVVNSIPHSLVITGTYTSDEQKLVVDITTICQHHHQLFGCFPVEKYLFLTLATHNNFGGLEHSQSTSLICPRKDLNNVAMNEHYMRFLSLCSHEYFHTWWIKSLKPKSFHNLDLERENYTTQLWIFEGITSYYDDYSLYRCGLIDKQQYFTLFAKTVNKVLQHSGNLQQSIADASFNAWTQLYQADENTSNAFANYYSKGALVAFILDVEIQKRTQSKLSLDSIVKYTYNNFYQNGLEDNDFQKVVEQLTQSCFQQFFADFVYGIQELPLQEAFDFVGVTMKYQPRKVSLGCEIKNNTVTRVNMGSVAEKYGIYVGDEIISFNNEKSCDILSEISEFDTGNKVNIGIVRDNITFFKDITLMLDPIAEVELIVKNT